MNEELIQYEREITIKDLLEQWLRNKEYQLKKSTILKYKNIINLHIIPEIGDVKLEEITYNTINQFMYNKSLTGRINDNKNLSKSYLKTMAIILSSAINYAILYGLTKPLVGKIIKPSITNSKIIALTKEEQYKLEKHLSKYKDNTELAIIIALNTGLRIDEICALSWADIDLNKDILHVKKSGIKNFNFHILRHTFATRCIECDVDVKTLSEIMGHASVNITLNNYVHSSFENKRHQLGKQDNFD